MSSTRDFSNHVYFFFFAYSFQIKKADVERVNNKMSSVVHSFNQDLKAQKELISEQKARHSELDQNVTEVGQALAQHATQAGIPDEGFDSRIEGLEKQQDGLV